MRRSILYLPLLFILFSCGSKKDSTELNEETLPERFIVVLGIAQDAGFPQIGCANDCCKAYWEGEESQYITSLAIVDNLSGQYWLLEATPDITWQLHELQDYLTAGDDYSPDGVFVTHAHIGHYSGLMQFGKEAMGAKSIPVWAMPRMDSFLRNNGPWSQLVKQENISLNPLKADSAVVLNEHLRITPFRVPHRDEYSETIGFTIESITNKILFIPDIDKWEKWDRDIKEEVKKADKALLDGTFFENGELPGRDMSEIPHPFVEESIRKFSPLPDSIRSRITFIHFNHTNPMIIMKSIEKDNIKKAGYGVAEEGMIITL